MKRLIKIALTVVARTLECQRKRPNVEYPQTWYWMPRKRDYPRLRKSIQWLCGLLTRHELSDTEWGYGGGEYADRNCRWCDKVFKAPKDSIRFQFKGSGELMKLVGNKEGAKRKK